MNNILERVRKRFDAYSLSKGQRNIPKTKVTDLDKVLDKSTKAIIPVDKDKHIIKVLEGKSVIIQFDSMLKSETIELLKEDIQNQIKENGFAIVDGRCKIFEFDNPKHPIKTKVGDAQ